MFHDAVIKKFPVSGSHQGREGHNGEAVRWWWSYLWAVAILHTPGSRSLSLYVLGRWHKIRYG